MRTTQNKKRSRTQSEAQQEKTQTQVIEAHQNHLENSAWASLVTTKNINQFQNHGEAFFKKWGFSVGHYLPDRLIIQVSCAAHFQKLHIQDYGISHYLPEQSPPTP